MYKCCQIISHKPTPSTGKAWTCWRIFQAQTCIFLLYYVVLPKHPADLSVMCEWNRCFARNSVANNKKKIVARGLSKLSCGGSEGRREGERAGGGDWGVGGALNQSLIWLGESNVCFNHGSCVNVCFNHGSYATVQQRTVKVLKTDYSIFRCVGGTEDGRLLERECSALPNHPPTCR